jgi:hypothetical protein
MLLTQFQNIIKSGSETIEKMQNFHKVVQNQKKIAEMLTCLYHDGAAIHPKLLEEVESIYKE